MVASEITTSGSDPIDRLNELISSSEAARLCGVALNTITTWRTRGLIEPSGLDDRGRPLYRFIDIARAERATRDRARRNR